jgi:hypothetical protein
MGVGGAGEQIGGFLQQVYRPILLRSMKELKKYEKRK